MPPSPTSPTQNRDSDPSISPTPEDFCRLRAEIQRTQDTIAELLRFRSSRLSQGSMVCSDSFPKGVSPQNFRSPAQNALPSKISQSTCCNSNKTKPLHLFPETMVSYYQKHKPLLLFPLSARTTINTKTPSSFPKISKFPRGIIPSNSPNVTIASFYKKYKPPRLFPFSDPFNQRLRRQPFLSNKPPSRSLPKTTSSATPLPPLRSASGTDHHLDSSPRKKVMNSQHPGNLSTHPQDSSSPSFRTKQRIWVSKATSDHSTPTVIHPSNSRPLSQPSTVISTHPRTPQFSVPSSCPKHQSAFLNLQPKPEVIPTTMDPFSAAEESLAHHESLLTRSLHLPHPPKVNNLFVSPYDFKLPVVRYSIAFQPEFAPILIPNSRASPHARTSAPQKLVPSSRSFPLKEICLSRIKFPQLLALPCPASFPFRELQFFISILDDLTSFKSILIHPPVSSSPPSNITSTDIQQLLHWSVVKKVPRACSKRLINRVFKVMKSDGSSTRLIMDCRPLNQAVVPPPTFFLPSPQTLIPFILSFSFGWTSDFQSWFFQFLLHPDIASFFCFRFLNSIYALLVLAQGFSWAAVIAQFTSCFLNGTHPSSKECFLQGDSATWIDNTLLLAHSVESLRCRVDNFIARCETANAVLGAKDPLDLSSSSHINFAGMEFDLKAKTWSLKQTWREKAAETFRSVLNSSSVTTRQWLSLIGIAIWVLRVLLLPIALLDDCIEWVSRIHFTTDFDWDIPSPIWNKCRDTLSLFPPLLERKLSRALLPISTFPIITVFSDASTLALGGVLFPCSFVPAGCYWSSPLPSPQLSKNITFLELKAAHDFISLILLSLSQPICLRLIVDNEAVSYMLKKGRGCSFRFSSLIIEIHRQLWRRNSTLQVGWVPSDSNPADLPSRLISSPGWRALTEKSQTTPSFSHPIRLASSFCDVDEPFRSRLLL